jgi:glycosyltransferase involved in cell wall biosynthesis
MPVTSQLVSVVIPCFNSGATLERAIDSVFRQTWPSIEVIVVDDGSTDLNTRLTIERLTNVLVLSQQNKGLPAARNAGMSVAQGEYLLPLDADDWLEPRAIQRLLETLLENESAAFSFCHIQLHGEAQGVLRKSYNFFEQLFLNQLPYCILMPRNVWMTSGGYDETMKRGYEDWEFSIRLGINNKFAAVLPEPLFNYQVSKHGMLLSKSTALHAELWQEIQDKHTATFRPLNLIKQWRLWRAHPSTRRLDLYFILWILHRCLPVNIFSMFFSWLKRRFSHANRVTSQNCTGAKL